MNSNKKAKSQPASGDAKRTTEEIKKDLDKMFDDQLFTGLLGSKALEHQLEAIERDEARR